MLIIFLHLVGGNRVPNGITPGWDQVRMGSGETSRVLFCFRASMENVPSFFFFSHMEDSTVAFPQLKTTNITHIHCSLPTAEDHKYYPYIILIVPGLLGENKKQRVRSQNVLA